MTLDKQEKSRLGGWFAAGGAMSGLSGVIGASCCVLPILLINAGLSGGLVAQLAWFERAKPYMMAASAALIAAGVAAAFWRGRRPSRRTLALLLFASAFLAAAYALPLFEGRLVEWALGL